MLYIVDGGKRTDLEPLIPMAPAPVGRQGGTETVAVAMTVRRVEPVIADRVLAQVWVELLFDPVEIVLQGVRVVRTGPRAAADAVIRECTHSVHSRCEKADKHCPEGGA